MNPPTSASDGQQDRIHSSAACPAWQRWGIRKDFMAPGNKWHVRHDCGYEVTVDLADNAMAVIEAERAHERAGCDA